MSTSITQDRRQIGRNKLLVRFRYVVLLRDRRTLTGVKIESTIQSVLMFYTRYLWVSHGTHVRAKLPAGEINRCVVYLYPVRPLCMLAHHSIYTRTDVRATQDTRLHLSSKILFLLVSLYRVWSSLYVKHCVDLSVTDLIVATRREVKASRSRENHCIQSDAMNVSSTYSVHGCTVLE